MIETKDLTAEQRKQLMDDLKAEQKRSKAERKQAIKDYKNLAELFVTEHIGSLTTHKDVTSKIITRLFEDYQVVLDFKEQIYGQRAQDSYTSTTTDGRASITIGHNITIKFDGTEVVGIEKVKEFISSLADQDDNTKKLTKIVDVALKRNAKTGMLKPAKIIELNSLRDEFNSELFNEGLDIIVASQIRTRTSTFVMGYQYEDLDDGRSLKHEFRFSV